jgi:hypothetical protein
MTKLAKVRSLLTPVDGTFSRGNCLRILSSFLAAVFFVFSLFPYVLKAAATRSVLGSTSTGFVRWLERIAMSVDS